MREVVREAWQSRTPRERAVLATLGVVLAAALLVSLIQTATHARSRLRPSVTQLRSQLARLDEQAREIERLRTSPPVAASQSDLHALVRAQIGAELSRALVRIDARSPDEVEVVFGAVPFAKWLGWIAGLKGQQVRVASSRIEALTTPGLVSVTATLVREKAR